MTYINDELEIQDLDLLGEDYEIRFGKETKEICHDNFIEIYENLLDK